MAVTLAVSPAFKRLIFVGSKVTSQSTGLLADSWMSFSSADPVFRTIKSIFLLSPAVISLLSRPRGVVEFHLVGSRDHDFQL